MYKITMLTQAKEPVWSITYIIYFVLTVIATIVGLILINKFGKKEKTLTIILKVTAACLVASVIANRISVCIYNIYTLGNTSYSWWNLIFSSLCGLSSFMLGILVLFAKPNNIMFHFFVYVSIGGPIITSLYPDFVGKQGFIEPASFTGLMHHTIALFLSLSLLVTKRFKPDMKKFYVYPIGYVLCMVFGLFEVQVLKLPDAMQINSPLLSSLPNLTSWWMIGIISTIIVFVSILLYLHFREHQSFKEILSVFEFKKKEIDA